jgi:predicted XRE-type DNA-binding protein
MQKEEEIFIGSDNVFADIGHPHPEEALAKSKLMLRITTIIEDRGLSEEEVARLLRISPSNEVSSILDGLWKGQLSKFTVGQLMDYLFALKKDTEIIVRDAYRPVQFRVAAG